MKVWAQCVCVWGGFKGAQCCILYPGANHSITRSRGTRGGSSCQNSEEGDQVKLFVLRGAVTAN